MGRKTLILNKLLMDKDATIQVLRDQVEVGLKLTGSFFLALKVLGLKEINVADPGKHVTDLIKELKVLMEENARWARVFADMVAREHEIRKQILDWGEMVRAMQRELEQVIEKRKG